MKHSFLRTVCFLFVCLTFGVMCFGQSGQSRTSSTSAKPGSTSDRAFLQKAMEANEAEIELGRMAKSKAKNQKVKDSAAMMVKDHTNALNRLREVSGGRDSSSNSGGTTGRDTTSTSSNNGEIKLSAEH